MKRFEPRELALMIVAIVAAFVALPAGAQQGNSLSVVLDIDRDGSVIAVERLELAAPIREPVRWRMATATTTPIGVRRLLFVDILEITDGRGNKVTTIRREYGDRVEIIIPVQPLADNTVRVTYQVQNAVRFRDAHDELVWSVGHGWSTAIQRTTMDLKLPPEAVGSVTGQVIRAGSKPSAIAIRGTEATFDIVDPSGKQPPMLDLVFEPGVLTRPPFARGMAWFLKANPIVLFPVLVLLAMAGWRRYAGRGRGPQVLVMPRYEPPPDLPPAEAGYLIDGSLDPRDLAAMLLDLARRGFIRIEAGAPDEEVPYPGPDFVLRLVKPMDAWKGAYPYEHTMLFHTFYGGQWTKLSSLSLRFYAVIPAIERMIRDELEDKQLYLNRRRIAAQQLALAVVLAVVLGVAQFAGWFSVAQSWLVGDVALLSAAIIVVLFTRGLHHLTAKGARVFAELRGFEAFLDSVEADRMERITPDLFERFLPYAIALGVEHRWGAAFSTISSGPPLWWNAEKSGGIPDFVHLVSRSAMPPRRGPAKPVSSPQQKSATV